LEEIREAIYLKTGINIIKIDNPNWRINTRLAEETKNLMNKHRFSYSMTTWIEGDCIYLVINHKINDIYYLYSGQTINGLFYTDNEPEFLKLTKDILDTINIEEIIYAEYAEPGAMGNPGGLLFYIIIDGKLICYKTNIFSDKDTYKNAVSNLVKYSITSRYSDVINKKGLFKFYGGGFGNNAFINRNIDLSINNGYFCYLNKGKIYYIYCSVRGVFDRVAYMKRIRKRK
jgi:hypothetical protein